MRSLSVVQALVLGLLVVAPISAEDISGSAAQEVSKRYVGGLAATAANIARAAVVALESRHHTEAQIAAKKAKAAKAKGKGKGKATGRDVPAPDEFGPWDSTEDEFGSWVKRDMDTREPHHTEAQIAAKKAKAAKAKGKGKAAGRDVPAPDEFGPWDSTEDEFGSWVKREVDTREPHHTEAQIAAKKAKAAKAKGKGKNAGRDVDVETREPHHTEAQIAAKKAKAAKAKGKGKAAGRDVDVESREPHHTEAQIAAKKAKAAKAKGGKHA